MAESIRILCLHTQECHHGLQSSLKNGLHIIFPIFQTRANADHDDIYLDTILHEVCAICSTSYISATVKDVINNDTFCNSFTMKLIQISWQFIEILAKISFRRQN